MFEAYHVAIDPDLNCHTPKLMSHVVSPITQYTTSTEAIFNLRPETLSLRAKERHHNEEKNTICFLGVTQVGCRTGWVLVDSTHTSQLRDVRVEQ